jgi:hypothetical protein
MLSGTAVALIMCLESVHFSLLLLLLLPLNCHAVNFGDGELDFIYFPELLLPSLLSY